MVHFPDGDYEFVSNTKGGYIDWHADKFYQNGFLMRSYDDTKYSMFFISDVLPGTGFNGLCEQRFVTKNTGNYSDAIRISELGDKTDNEVYYGLESGAYPYPGWMIYACPGVLQYTRAAGTATTSVADVLGKKAGQSMVTSNRVADRFACIVDKNGNVMRKGAYKDLNNNAYFLINSSRNFLGVFEVPIKWGRKYVGWADYFFDVLKSMGVDPSTLSHDELVALNQTYVPSENFYIDKTFDWPYYKGDQIVGYDEYGNEKIKYNTWIPFTEKDYKGRTELDFVYDFQDNIDLCGNFVPGFYDLTLGLEDDQVPDVIGDGDQS